MVYALWFGISYLVGFVGISGVVVKTLGSEMGLVIKGDFRPPVEVIDGDRRKAIVSLLDRLSEGEYIQRIIHEAVGVSWSKFYQIVTNDPELNSLYEAARAAQSVNFADETVFIADNEEDYALARVRIDARKWHAGVFNPRKFGPKINHEHSGTISIKAALDAANARRERVIDCVYEELATDDVSVDELPEPLDLSMDDMLE